MIDEMTIAAVDDDIDSVYGDCGLSALAVDMEACFEINSQQYCFEELEPRTEAITACMLDLWLA